MYVWDAPAAELDDIEAVIVASTRRAERALYAFGRQA